MEISRSFKPSELNWGSLPDLPSRLQRLGVTVQRCSAELNLYPDKVTLDSLDEAVEYVRNNRSPHRYSIRLRGTREGNSFSLAILRGRNIHREEFLYIDVEDSEAQLVLDSVTQFFGLIPDKIVSLPPKPARTAFIACRFDSTGTECAEKLARFLELIGFRVVTGRGYSPTSVAQKVKSRIENQAIVFVIYTTGPENTWLIQESVLSDLKDKPLFLIKEQSVELKAGLLADHEYVPFEGPFIETTFIPILEGLRELGYVGFEEEQGRS